MIETLAYGGGVCVGKVVSEAGSGIEMMAKRVCAQCIEHS